MAITPEVSSIIGETTEFEVPVVSTRTATTRVRVPDGNTVAIGGLIQESDSQTQTKVPVLGDIPILGRLFKHDSKVLDKTDLYVFITGHILDDEKLKLATDAAKQSAGEPEIFKDALVQAQMPPGEGAQAPLVGSAEANGPKPLKIERRGVSASEVPGEGQ
jgi:type II secretory pathway component GspD/PulD (secretin)